jgi:hypothetical protein
VREGSWRKGEWVGVAGGEGRRSARSAGHESACGAAEKWMGNEMDEEEGI